MLTLDHLQVELDADTGVVRAIDALSLTIARGETFALVGESGCGKSMTALALMRLLPENGAVTGGDIRLGAAAGQGSEVDILGLPEAGMRAVRGRRIGMIFQEPGTSLNPVLTVATQLVEAIETHTPLRGDAARAKAIDWLRRVGIPEPERRIDDYPFRMSGGQKQRVMIAMALAAEPDFLIADEPTTALDVTIQKQILDLLRELQQEKGMGLLLITHDLAVVAGMAHRVALMYAGQIIELAPAAQFFAAPRHPYARALLQALPDSARRGRPLAAIAGTVPALTQRFDACRFAPRCSHAVDACRRGEPRLLGDGAAGPEGERLVRCVRVPPAGPGLPDEAAPIATAQAAGAAPNTLPAEASGNAVAARPALLQVRDLHVHFALRRRILSRAKPAYHAVDGVSFDVPSGGTLALVGESGCGKTTTGKAIVQLLRGHATLSGQALLNGQDLFTLQGAALREARRAVQIIFQDPYASLNPRMRVAEVLDEGLAALQPQHTAAERRGRIERIADQVGLRRDALQRWPHEFSGGQRQRIAIARALAVEPQLLICDEPTSALDVSVQAQILNLLRELQRDLGISLLFITHNIAVVEYIADRIAVMERGRIVEQGDCASVLRAPREGYTKKLLAAVPRL